MRDWINEANNEGYWNQLVKRLLHPNMPLPERPETWGPLPLWRARRAAGVLPIATQMMTMMMMRAIAMMATTTAETIEGAITMNHEDENSTNPPRHCDAPPLCTSHDCNLILPPLWNTIQNGGSMMRIFCIQVGRSMFQSLTILGLGHGSSETVIKVHY